MNRKIGGRAAREPDLGSRLALDWQANRGNLKGRVVVPLFRVAQAVARSKATDRKRYLVGVPYLIVYRLLVEWTLGIELPPGTDVGPGLAIQHGQGLVVNTKTIIGSNAMLRNGVTIGNRLLADGSETACPVIGSDVEFGANAVVVGAITIGDGARIGAGAVVTKSVPAGGVARGNPALIIPPLEPAIQ